MANQFISEAVWPKYHRGVSVDELTVLSFWRPVYSWWARLAGNVTSNLLMNPFVIDHFVVVLDGKCSWSF